MSTKKERLESLDILRGFDLWLLLMIGPIAEVINWTYTGPFVDALRHQTLHVDWHGFVLWDIIMPLFMFMSGVTIPFSMSKYRNGEKPGKQFYLRLLKRFCLLFFLGWIVQGHLLDLNPHTFHPFANTLQAIAVGYVGASLIYVYCGNKARIGATAALFIAYILVFAFSGTLHPDQYDNIAMTIDKAVLGSHRDGVIWNADGSWAYNPAYQYTWILSSLNFIVTVMLGCFSGELLKNGSGKKGLKLFCMGLALTAAGLIMDPIFPIIKKIWSSSMTLFAGGISCIMLAFTYYIVDVKGWKKGIDWLKIFGMNSIAAYVIGEVIVFNSVSNSLLHGFEQFFGIYYPVLIAFANTIILALILKLMYKNKIFLKV